MADSAKWYVIHTYSGYENKVANNIETVVENRQMQDQILEVKIPMETVTEIKDNKKRDVERKVFPGLRSGEACGRCGGRGVRYGQTILGTSFAIRAALRAL